MSSPEFLGRALALLAATFLPLIVPKLAQAQGGPPFITNDPGTPGDTNWEINLAAAPTVTHAGTEWQVPQVDLNYGLGDRIQLTYEIPYVISTASGQPTHSGWGNAFPGVKWRFLDQGEDGYQASVFPQIETGVSRQAQLNGMGGPGPRLLLPAEITKEFGETDFDLEYGQYVPIHGNGPRERIIGFVVGRPVSEKLELDAELYDDRAKNALPHETTIDIGGRYKFHPGLLWLFMVGRSLSGTSGGNTQFMGYFGIQILLSDYGRKLNTSDEAP